MVNFVEMLVDFMEIKSGMDIVVNVIVKYINIQDKFKKYPMENQGNKTLDFDKYDIYYFSNTTPNGTPPTSVQSSPSFSNFQEKRRSNISMRNPIRQVINRAGSLRCMYANTHRFLTIFSLCSLQQFCNIIIYRRRKFLRK